MKICKKCGRELDESSFPRNKKLKDGLSSICRDCSNAAQRAWYHDHKVVGGGKSMNLVYSNPELAKFTPRQLIDELRARGYTGELKYTQTIKL